MKPDGRRLWREAQDILAWVQAQQDKEAGMATCRSCGATIHWVELASGKKMPVDEACRVVLTADDPGDPDGGPLSGTWVVELQGKDGQAVVIDVPKGRGVARLSRPHWATCPQAEQWRKGKGQEAPDQTKEVQDDERGECGRG